MEISILDVNFEDEDYEIKNPDKIIVGNIFDKPGNIAVEKNNEFIIGKKTKEGLNIRFVDKNKSGGFTKRLKITCIFYKISVYY